MGETCKRFHAGRHRRGMPIVCGRPVYRDGECRAHWRLRIDAALAAARDEVIAAARGWAGSVDSAERRLYEMELARAVAALDKLEGR